ncbi:GlsB/YeaQ/YmgE family stress response membrane protein [Anianabacter salinae]|uniref:GlsB/YeaQ/YmgE family stress response membrane protein n=1 Tax=Anianabacter salinae TaxID=2851023 RepID=UPI00225E160D|nr:GlsB/YeaQ/YmgE family stress response membrane protein [Anianabacter salinae]MBV0910786.1 GlsB/YeaQ/YmgE family stress response membrane protein [Anianabacter salinae]
MSVVLLIIIGAGAGFLATRLMNVHTDIITTVAIGIFGALVGGFVLRALITVMGALAGFVGAVLGAIALIWLWQKYGPRR